MSRFWKCRWTPTSPPADIATAVSGSKYDQARTCRQALLSGAVRRDQNVQGSFMTTTALSLVLAAIVATGLSGCGGGPSEPDPASPPASSPLPPPPAQKHALTVTLSGSGSVTSTPAGIDCGSDCSESYDQGTAVTLSAAAASGQQFQSWGGACAGSSSSCTLSMAAARDVSAQFVANTPPADVQAPTVPGNLTAQASATQVSLSWNASTDNFGV
ncbi:MAG: InlB B-repeat-containing protein, partial [Steroidobacteraceae bacterium]